MKIHILLIILFTSIGFAETFHDSDDMCAVEGKTLSIENGPFIFKEIKLNGPHVHLMNPNGSHLYFNCAKGIAQFNRDNKSTVTEDSKNSGKVTQKIEDQNWLVVQERNNYEEPSMFDFVIRLYLRNARRGTNEKMDPLKITNKNENPVRTQVTVDYIESAVVVQDPTDNTQKLKIACTREGAVGVVVTKNGKKEALKIKAPSFDGYRPPTARDEYKCYSKISYNYKTGAVGTEVETKKRVPLVKPTKEIYATMPIPPIISPPSDNLEGGFATEKGANR